MSTHFSDTTLGCGAGLDLLIAARKTGPTGHVIGVDLSEIMAARARASAKQAGLDNVEVRLGAIEEIPVGSGSVDWVVSNCVMNLAADRQRAFREIHRVLKPDGRMPVSDIVADGLPDWMRDSAELRAACAADAPSEAEYLETVRAVGLADVTVVDQITFDDAQLRYFACEMLPSARDCLASSWNKTRAETPGAL